MRTIKTADAKSSFIVFIKGDNCGKCFLHDWQLPAKYRFVYAVFSVRLTLCQSFNIVIAQCCNQWL